MNWDAMLDAIRSYWITWAFSRRRIPAPANDNELAEVANGSR